MGFAFKLARLELYVPRVIVIDSVKGFREAFFADPAYCLDRCSQEFSVTNKPLFWKRYGVCMIDLEQPSIDRTAESKRYFSGLT